MKIKLINIIISALITLSFSSVIFAADNNIVLASNQTFSSRIMEQLKNIFSSDKNLQIASSSLESATATSQATTTIRTLDAAQNNDTITTTTSSSTAISTSTTNTKCIGEEKVLYRIERVEQQIRSEIKDKNKLVENLNQIASSTQDLETKELIDKKIFRLETLVADVITRQKELSNSLSSSTEYICNKSLSKSSAANENKIKSSELNINKKLSEINTYIKVDIKNVVEGIE